MLNMTELYQNAMSKAQMETRKARARTNPTRQEERRMQRRNRKKPPPRKCQ